ncbi:nitroreductase [Actinokineospora auranticolor]|uniref:Nitroreductase n=1 Tax=Actinokineospora auranticolor TaxID=155976 RepID=A0A2S6GCH4_9PSEU|nr:nitroreductase [Actinokineospora auranticolor]PPK62545.1 hypothetical protein CLV40_1347 [Actinokineospora auranticolor]
MPGEPFPVDAAIARAVRAAGRVSSPYGTRPWRFVVLERRVGVKLDPDRVLRVADPHGQGARVACGATVYALRLVLAVTGWSSSVAVLPDRRDPDLVAEVRVGPRHRTTAEERSLALAVERGGGNRWPVLRRAVPEPARAALAKAARLEGARLHLIEDPDDQATVAAVIRRADFLRSRDDEYRAELRARQAREEGTYGLDTIGGGPEPLLAVLTTPTDTTVDQVIAGQALQRVLLEADIAGLAVSLLPRPVELPQTRSALHTTTGATPHAVLRIGFGHGSGPAPRRAGSEPGRAVTGFSPLG